MAELSITTGLREIASRLTDAAAIAKAAVTPDRVRGRLCAESGSERAALRIAMDLHQLLHEGATCAGRSTCSAG